eukprot:scaffold1917_cov333-Pavlova_lutheri.AAC.2
MEDEALLLDDKDFCTVPGAADVSACDWIVEELEDQNPGVPYGFFYSKEEDCNNQSVEGNVVDWFSGGCNGPKIVNRLCGCCVFTPEPVPPPLQPECITSEDCVEPTAPVCVSGFCVACAPIEAPPVQGNCPGETFCQADGSCTPEQCEEDDDCGMNLVCQDNECKCELEGLEPREVDGVCIAPPGEILVFDTEGNPVPVENGNRRLLQEDDEFDFPTIASAVEAAGEDFVIYLGSGRYTFDLSGLDEEGVQLLGAQFGIDARERDRDIDEFESILETIGIINVDENKFVLDGFLIELNDGCVTIQQDSEEVLVANNIFSGETRNNVFGAVHIRSTANFATLLQNKFSFIRRRNNTEIEFFQANAVFLGEPSGTLEGLVIRQNEFVDIGNQAISTQQDSFDTVLTDFVIEDNSIMDVGGICIQMYAREIENGIIQRNSMQGFNVGRERAALWFRVAGVPTDLVQNVAITQNVITGDQAIPAFEGNIGIHFTIDTTDPADYINVTVEDNLIQNNKIGLLVSNLGDAGAEADLLVSGNQFNANGRFESGSAVGAQVRLEGSTLLDLGIVLETNEFTPDSVIRFSPFFQIIQEQ